MKKTVFLIVLLVLLNAFLFASSPISLQVNLGGGYLEGKRYLTRDNGTIDNQVSLKADGIEAGFLLAYDWENFGVEAFFDYLFALEGSFDPINAPDPGRIPEKVRYTDYKAGVGIRSFLTLSEKDSLRYAVGLNFTGISNHYYLESSCKTQYAGNKVTSFGVYLACSEIHELTAKLSVSLGLHTNLNPIGVIRNFNPETRRWFFYFPKDGTPTVHLISSFVQLGLVYHL